METGPAADLNRRAPFERGPLWGTATDDLNPTLLSWPPGEGSPEHLNPERDVIVVVPEVAGTVRIDGAEHPIEARQGAGG